MRVKCVICDTIEELVDDTLEAKRLRNRPIHTHMCKTCNERIELRTKERLATGKFHFYRSSRKIEEDF
ncbi:YlaI family protein [Metaplanococcus flavidus]|uniref:YlaI family protein n=1 Tax=Metaplanococcus flavidus TaxID=569883 RepID=A0ABW3L9V2_9BACL